MPNTVSWRMIPSAIATPEDEHAMSMKLPGRPPPCLRRRRERRLAAS